MTELVKFVSNDYDELIKQINTHATENYEDIHQVVGGVEKTTIEDVAVYTAVVVFRRRKL